MNMPTEFCMSVIAQCLSNHKETQGSMFGHTERKKLQVHLTFSTKRKFYKGINAFCSCNAFKTEGKNITGIKRCFQMAIAIVAVASLLHVK